MELSALQDFGYTYSPPGLVLPSGPYWVFFSFMPEARHVSGGPGSTQNTVNGLYHPFKSLGDIQNGKGNEKAEPDGVDKHGCGLEGPGQFRFFHHHGVYLTADAKDFRSDGEPEVWSASLLFEEF
nr:hypothetical protein [Dehalococcoides sp.]